MYESMPKLSRHYVESYVSDVEIMAHYLDISTQTVLDCINKNELICSPLRTDRHPTCGFYVSANGKLRFNDFAGYFHGDMYDLVGYRTLLDPRDPREFMLILHRICQDFNLWYYKLDGGGHTNTMIDQIDLKPKGYTEIEVQPRDWDGRDKKYWRNYGLELEDVDAAHISPAYYVWLNGRTIYANTVKDPCYAIFCGVLEGLEQWKLYFPKRKSNDKLPRFLTNTRRMQNMGSIKPAPYGVITKAIKDALVLNKYGVPAVAVAAESIYPTQKEISYIKNKWKTVYSLMDFDLTGIKMAISLRKKDKIEPLFITTGRWTTYNYRAKDVSDFRSLHGDYVTKQLIDLVIESNGTFDRDYYEELQTFLTPF